jgi:hypothetical protein
MLNLWRSVRDRLILPLGEPRYFREDEDELARRLKTSDTKLAAALLAEAEELARRPHADAESIDRRATTLQGAVALATTVALASGALLLDPTKLRSEGWRITFAAVLAGVVVAFVASGMRALGASSRTLPWSYPAFEDIFGRAESDVAAAQAARAASLLKTAGLNFRIVELKAGYLNAAVWWFRIALALLLALAILFATYAATTPEEPSAREGRGQGQREGVAESAPAVAIATHPKKLQFGHLQDAVLNLKAP